MQRAWGYVAGLVVIGAALSAVPPRLGAGSAITPLGNVGEVLLGLLPFLGGVVLMIAAVLSVHMMGVRRRMVGAPPVGDSRARAVLALGVGLVLVTLLADVSIGGWLANVSLGWALLAVSATLRVVGAGLIALWLFDRLLHPDRADGTAVRQGVAGATTR